MTEVNKTLATMFTADEQNAMEQAVFGSFPSISAAVRHVELRKVLDDPASSEVEKGAAATAIEAGIDARAKVVAPRIVKMAEGAATTDAEDLNSFALKSLMEQVEDVLASVTIQAQPLTSTAKTVLLMDATDRAVSDSEDLMRAEAASTLRSSMARALARTFSPLDEHELRDDYSMFVGKVLDESTISWRTAEVDDENRAVWIECTGDWIDAPVATVPVAEAV
jgi:uncharacterized protein (DUF1778 family)